MRKHWGIWNNAQQVFLFFYGIKRFLQGNTTKFNIIMSYTLHKDTIKSLDIFQNMNPHIKHFREPSLFLTCCISSTESLNRQENNLFFFFFPILVWFQQHSWIIQQTRLLRHTRTTSIKHRKAVQIVSSNEWVKKWKTKCESLKKPTLRTSTFIVMPSLGMGIEDRY